MQACKGPVTMNDIYAGEAYDARLEQPGWSKPDFAGSCQPSVNVAPPSNNVSVRQSYLQTLLSYA